MKIVSSFLSYTAQTQWKSQASANSLSTSHSYHICTKGAFGTTWTTAAQKSTVVTLKDASQVFNYETWPVFTWILLLRISEFTKFNFWQCHASFSLLLMEGSANAPYLESLQRKEKVCHSVHCGITGRSNIANALEKDDVEESWKVPLWNPRSFQLHSKRTNYCECIKKKIESNKSQKSLLLRVSFFASKRVCQPPQSLSLNGTKPDKIKQRCSHYLLSTLRMFTRWLLFSSSQHEEDWYFGSKLGNMIFWQNPPMAGNSASILIEWVRQQPRLNTGIRAPSAWCSKMW